MKRVIIFFEHIVREYEACVNLKKEIEKESDCEVYLFSIAFEYFDALKLAKKKKIDMVLMPWIYTDADYELVKPFLKCNSRIVVVNLHQEQIGTEAYESILFPRGNNAKNAVIHFVWGSFFKKKLKDVGVEEGLIYETGNTRSDLIYYVNSKNRIEIAREFDLLPQKRWILFSENRGWVLDFNRKMYEYMIFRGIDVKDIYERKRFDEKSLELTINEIENLPDEFFESNELIYRPHPGTKSPKFTNKKVKVISEYSIYEWIKVVDVNVVWNSTSIFESDAYGTPSIVYQPIELPKRYRICGLNEYPKIKKLQDINEGLIDRYKRNVLQKKVYEKYIGKVDGKAIFRTKEVIMDLLNDSNIAEKLNKNYEMYDKKWMVRRYFFEKLTKIAVNLGILNYIKYPKTAYRLIKDIPYSKDFKDKAKFS